MAIPTASLWQPVGRPIPVEPFGDMMPVETLEYYDGPKSFTFVDTTGRTFYAHWADCCLATEMFIVVPMDADRLSRLLDNSLPLRDALDCGETYAVQTDRAGTPEKAWAVAFADVPDDVLPMPGVCLRPPPTPQPKDVP